MQPSSLTLPAELTLLHMHALAQALIRFVQSSAAVELDLSEVVYMDTTGVQLLLMLRQEAARRQIPLHFAQPSPAVLEVFDLYRLGAQLAGPEGFAA